MRSVYLKFVASGLLLLGLLGVVRESQAQPTVLVDWSAQWRYMITTNDIGTTWYSVGFNDASWPIGNGSFAYPGGEAMPAGAGGVSTTLARNDIWGYRFRTDSISPASRAS